MKRRGFLGLLGGAAASGPTLAHGLAHDVLSVRSGSGSAGMMACASSRSRDYSAERISEIRDLLSGRKKEDEREARRQRLFEIEQRERHRIDSLRSVSGHHKVAMLQNGERDRQKRIHKTFLEQELENLLSGMR